MSKEKRTHHGRGDQRRAFDYFTVRPDSRLGFIVHGFTRHPANSVLAGQPCKVFLDSFDTEIGAREIYPDAQFGNCWTDPEVSLSHLPGENDFVAGGAYPDDIDDGY